MASSAVAVPAILVGAGFLYWAPLGTSLPTHVAAGSVFTDTWPVAWLPAGATAEGSTFNYETSVEPIQVAEFFDPVKYATVSRTGSFAFAMASWTLTNLKRALNGGTITTTGTGATSVNAYTLPNPGQEVRAMIGWESEDGSARLIFPQCLSSGTIESSFQKAPDFARIPVTYNMEVPSGGQPFLPFTAGTARA